MLIVFRSVAIIDFIRSASSGTGSRSGSVELVKFLMIL